MNEALVFANCNISKKDKITYLPVYMVMFLEKDEEQLVLEKISF